MDLTYLLILVVLVALMAIANALLVKKGAASLPYEAQDALFTPAELAFLHVLQQAVRDEYRIFGKVRLADVVKVKRGLDRSRYQSAFNRIQSKHLDFVVCRADDLSVAFVVELDDRSHRRKSAQKRDEVKNQALSAANVPLFRFCVQRNYDISTIRNTLFASSPPA